MNSKFSLSIDIAIASCVVVALIVAATSTQQYSYYILLRWLVMTTCVYFSYKSYKINQIGLLIFYCAVAIMFNPFKKIRLQKETWHLINYAVAIILTLIIIYEVIQFLRLNNKDD